MAVHVWARCIATSSQRTCSSALAVHSRSATLEWLR
jgi:hypothetical protein